jgi:hypothetical protein
MAIVDFVIHVRIYVIALRLPAVQIVQTVLDVSQEHLMDQRKDMNAEWNGKCHLGFCGLIAFLSIITCTRVGMHQNQYFD